MITMFKNGIIYLLIQENGNGGGGQIILGGKIKDANIVKQSMM